MSRTAETCGMDEIIGILEMSFKAVVEVRDCNSAKVKQVLQ